jgi:NNP family nitrate/nitrite transporter-like MFS transporter
MTNINAFFPLRKKGWALGLNAGGGNIGVPVVQLIGLAVIGAGGGPRVLLGIYIPFIVIAAVLGALYMDNIASLKNDTGAAKDAVKDAHTWIMSFLYIGTFGSFIGYSFAFGQVLTNQFGRTPLEAAYVTFIGPLLGSLIRPLGGWLADKYGGAKITLYNYVGMGVPHFLDQLVKELRQGPSDSQEIGESGIQHGHDLRRQGFTIGPGTTTATSASP